MYINNPGHLTNVYINHDPVMTLTEFMARSTFVAYSFEWGKLLKCLLKKHLAEKVQWV